MKRLFVGIDVQVQRPCAFAAVGASGSVIQSGWFPTATDGFQCLEPLAEKYELHFGIDAPRVPISKPRKWYWNGAKKEWRERKPSEKGVGRHCEVAVKAHNLANPQWTPLATEAPGNG
ncbi:hypothetical protein P4C99_19755 [Pontiellaceae bacterium B1224]|nr:hypothetical protein [Pontiellaceae bacterium B1224]